LTARKQNATITYPVKEVQTFYKYEIHTRGLTDNAANDLAIIRRTPHEHIVPLEEQEVIEDLE